jgi:hypothetical protein
MRASEFDGFGVASVGMTKNTHARVTGENAFKTAFGIIGTVGNDNHPSVL